MGGNTGRRVGVTGGGAPNTTPPASASGATQFTDTQFGKVVTDQPIHKQELNIRTMAIDQLRPLR
jgi:hypothetical protein